MQADDFARIIAIVGAVSLGLSLVEMALLTVVRKQESFKHAYAGPLKNAVVLAVLDSLLPILGTVGFATLGSQVTPFATGSHWLWWPLGLLVFEFWYWFQHMLGHKVRLLWCIHAPHHSPDTLTSLIGLGRNWLELPYLGFFLGFMTAFCGVPLEVVIVWSIVDGFWGKFLHVSPKLVPGRYGPLEHFLQTPSYHRVHHGKNLRYMDTNYATITLFWDWAFGTLEPLRDDEPADFGVTRTVDSESWLDVQFSEAIALARDVRDAPGLWNKLAYLVMPPGWSHDGSHQTVAQQKRLARAAG